MVALSTAQISNSSVSTSLPAGMVAVFVGATSGIGEYAFKSFAEQAKSPRMYMVGRSQESANRIIKEAKTLNAGGQYTFIKSDVSLLNNVDEVCRQILSKESVINLLFQSQGTMVMQKTSEGLSIAYVLPVTSRFLFAINLLPALQRATHLKRVVSVFAGGYEGPFNDEDWAEYALKKPFKSRGHVASIITMAHNVMAQQAPDVSFIHIYPGAVQTPFGKDVTGGMAVLRVMFNVVGKLVISYIPAAECGSQQLYVATSARFPPKLGNAAGVPLTNGVAVARGADGTPGSGSYTINYNGENVSLDVDKRLARAKADGMEEKLWTHILGEIKQITGKSH